MKKNNLTDNEISAILNDPDKMTLILKTAVNAALIVHKRAGNPVCGQKNGRLIWLPADEIPTYPEDDK